MIEITDKTTGEIKLWTESDYDAERTRLLLAWDAAKAALDIAKECEMAARKAVVDFAFDPNKTSGTERVELGGGYEAKAVKKLNYGWRKNAEGKLDKNAIETALATIEKEGPIGELIAERLVKWEPTLSLTEYKLLAPQHKAIIDEVIVTSEGAPTLEIIAPKAKK